MGRGGGHGQPTGTGPEGLRGHAPLSRRRDPGAAPAATHGGPRHHQGGLRGFRRTSREDDGEVVELGGLRLQEGPRGRQRSPRYWRTARLEGDPLSPVTFAIAMGHGRLAVFISRLPMRLPPLSVSVSVSVSAFRSPFAFPFLVGSEAAGQTPRMARATSRAAST